ncbi:hypothetical protein LCGC14_2741090 [marine sediment metagenome]|uniref:Uncharacterized protein n=1 Tax=marine sediment metagenome TaxID=412755 RepID=A0A0F8Z4F5_9ZZZZ
MGGTALQRLVPKATTDDADPKVVAIYACKLCGLLYWEVHET